MAPHEVIIDEVSYGMSDTITELNVREGVTSIPKECCRLCVNLTSVILPASLESIGFRAFRWCKSLRKITLPESLSSIGWQCFFGCSKLIGLPSACAFSFVDCVEWSELEGECGQSRVIYNYCGCNTASTLVNERQIVKEKMKAQSQFRATSIIQRLKVSWEGVEWI